MAEENEAATSENQPGPPVTLTPPILNHHLTGGLILLIGSNGAAVIMSPGKDGPMFFCVPNNTQTQLLFEKQEPLRILAKTRFEVAEEMKLPVTPNFILSATDEKHHCLADAQFHLWSGIGIALSHRKEDGDAMVANRVGQQIHFCLRRLEKLSNAYRISLAHLAQTQPLPEPGKLSFTRDLCAHNLGTEYRSCINELYSLRDAVLAAAFRLGFKNIEPFMMRRIRSLVIAQPRSGSSDLIYRSMFDENGDRIIYLMSLYRSIALHCLGATNPVVGDVYRLKISEGIYGEIPYVEYPLYDDIEKMEAIEKGASKAIFDAPDRDEAIRFMSLQKHIDALEFCYNCFVHLLRITSALAKEIGIAPETTVIGRHYKKNKETGKLEKIKD